MGNLQSRPSGSPFRMNRYGYQCQEYPTPHVFPPGPGPPPHAPVDMAPNGHNDPNRGASHYGPGAQESLSYAQSLQPQRGPVGTGRTTPLDDLSPEHLQVYSQQGYQRYPQQGYYPPQYPPPGQYPQDYPPQSYYPEQYPGHPGYPGYQGYPGYPPQGGYYQQGYPPPGQYNQGQQQGSLANTAFCASCVACITCLLCSCCQGLLGVAPDPDSPGEDYGPSQPVEVGPPGGVTTAPGNFVTPPITSSPGPAV